jgi:L-methionine (R)-S-oxide reductase
MKKLDGPGSTSPTRRLQSACGSSDLGRELAALAAARESRSHRAKLAADLIRRATNKRWIGIYTVTETSVVNEAWSGPGAPAFPTFDCKHGLTGHALRARATVLSNDVANDPRYLANQDDSGSELIVPILHGGDAIGTLDVESGEIGAFDGRSIAFFEDCAAALIGLWDEHVS